MTRIRKRKAESEKRTSRQRRAGFTLIELMVSVTLAIIIITLFATIYSWSTDTYATQKGIRRNDQRSRMMVTVIKGDLQNRTFVDVVPFWPGQNTSAGFGTAFVANERRGYFCISENDPDNTADDVLYLTVEIPNDNAQRAYTGRAKALFNPTAIDPRTGNPYTDNPTGWALYLVDHPNQPEMDDGQVSINAGNVTGVLNHATSSRAAEVAYFLRNGNLYRRILLIRDPYNQGTTTTGAQPTEIPGDYNGAVVRYDGDGDGVNDATSNGYFWRDLAISAYYKPTGTNPGVKFHDRASSLVNENPPVAVADFTPPFPASLGIPPLRFGHSLLRGTTAPHPPMFVPREYVGPSGSEVFTGRFLTRETGDASFLYPGSLLGGVAGNDPHARTDLTYDNATGLVSQYSANTTHRGEDILMTNVHEFDVKVWDSAIGQFVNLGHNTQDSTTGTPIGDYNRTRNRTWDATAMTIDWNWNRFDTWHPYASPTPPTNADNPDPLGPPPYKAYRPPGTVPLIGAVDATTGNRLEHPLLAIQITIRFFDVATKQMRQLTIQHSLKK